MQPTDRSWQTDLPAFLDPGGLPGALLYGVGLLLAAGLLARSARRLVALADRGGGRFPVDRTSLTFVAQLLQLVVYLTAAILYLHLVPGLRAVGTALLAGVSIVSIVIGLAAQSTLSNFIAGVSLLLYRPFSVGHRLSINAPTGVETGEVRAVTLGYTVLETFDARRVVVPNSAIFNQVTVNHSAGPARALASVPVTIGYDADLGEARRLLVELAAAHEAVVEVLDCPVTALADGGVTLTLRAWCADARTAERVRNELLEGALLRFLAEGVPPYPARAAG